MPGPWEKYQQQPSGNSTPPLPQASGARSIPGTGPRQPAPPSGYRPTGGGLEPIPGGPADPNARPTPAPSAPSGYRFTEGGDLEAIPGGPAGGGAGGNASESERKAGAFLIRALGANEAYEGAGVGARSLPGQVFRDTAPDVSNYFVSGERQVADSAQDEFIAASLRQDSGAAIPEEELERQRRIYFPMPGDGPEVLEQKRQARLRAIEGLRQSAGRLEASAQERYDALFGSAENRQSPNSQNENMGLDEYIGTPPNAVQSDEEGLVIGSVSPVYYDEQGNEASDNYTGPAYDQDGNLYGHITRDADGNRQWVSREAMDIANRRIEQFGRYGSIDLAGHNVGGRLTDEAAGVGGAISGLLRGDTDIAGNYEANRDAEQYLIDQARQNSGAFGTAMELLGGAASVGGKAGDLMRAGRAAAAANGGQVTRAGVQSALARQAAADGARAGAVFGFGEGRGFEDSATNTLLGMGAGALAGNVGQRIGNAVANRAAGAAGTRQTVEGIADAAERRGIDLLPADVGGTGTRMATSVARRTLGEIPIASAAQRSVDSARVARNAVADDIGRATDEAGAGQAIRRGVQDWQERSADRVEQLFRQVPVPRQAQMTLGETRAALGEINQGLSSNSALSEIWASNPRLQRTAQALQDGNLTWDDAQRFRSIVGDIIGRPSMASEGPEISQLRRLYGALTRDMEETASQAGPRALTAWRRAVDYKRGRERRIEEVMRSILGPRDNRPDAAVFEQVNRWANQRGGDSRSIGRLMRSLEPEEQNTVRATLLGRMGDATRGQQNAAGDAFSPARFVTEWSGMSERARSALFPSREHRDAIDDLVTVLDGMKRAGAYTNYSMTSIGTNAVATGGLAIANPVLGGLAALGQLGAGKLLSSPRFTRLLVAMSRNEVPAQTARMRMDSLVRTEPAIASEIAAFRNSLIANDNAILPASTAANPEQEQE